MESATFEMLETTVDRTVLILSDVRKSTKRDGSTTILEPHDSPFRAASTPTLAESASHHLWQTMSSSDACSECERRILKEFLWDTRGVSIMIVPEAHDN